jgi:hypothetical protein
MRNRGLNYLIFAAVIVSLAAVVVLAADPVPPDTFTAEEPERRTLGDVGKVEEAQAGNVTELSINATTITQGWQGYYGNVSGRIVLDDSNNNSMYSWDLVDPEGEIFATRDSDGITWSGGNIICADITHIQSEESTLNFNLGTGQDVDGINETFSKSTHPEFNISDTGFASDSCAFSLSTYVDDSSDPENRYKEKLLNSTSESSLIYMAFIVAAGSDGFKDDDVAYDFQMLVAEDGHDGDTNPTDYYFYVELN